MTTQNALRLLGFAALLFTGCSSSSRPSDAQTARSSSHAAQPHGFTTGTLVDPTMNGMEAQTLTIPAGWKVQGIVMMSPCTQLPLRPVYRAYAPDGLTEMRLTPAIAWKWTPDPRAPREQGCFPYSGPVSAAELLGKYVETLTGGVHVVGPMPVDAVYRKAADDYTAVLNHGASDWAQRTGGHVGAHFTNDVAALHIQTRNGSFVIDQRLRTAVQCASRSGFRGGVGAGGDCLAQIEILRAPQGKLDALVHLVDANNLPNLQPTMQWKQAEMQLIGQRGQEGLKRMHEMFVAGTQAQKAMFDSFMQNTQRNHDAVMNQMESSFRSSMNNAQASQNARTTAASDVVDYALDQQTVTGQGGTAKVSSAYSQTWSNTVGNQTTWYQTNDPNANPNGALPGNWTQDTKVHGNGQPY